jgi:hypothetical protein
VPACNVEFQGFQSVSVQGVCVSSVELRGLNTLSRLSPPANCVSISKITQLNDGQGWCKGWKLGGGGGGSTPIGFGQVRAPLTSKAPLT